MRFQLAKLGEGLLSRGLYVLPIIAQDGSMMVCAVQSNHRVSASGVLLMAWGANLDVLAEQLADELEKTDPVTDQVRRKMLKVG